MEWKVKEEMKGRRERMLVRKEFFGLARTNTEREQTRPSEEERREKERKRERKRERELPRYGTR
jgi:hypothetical protein